MKTLTLSAIAFTLIAGAAAAATSSDYTRFDIDADKLTSVQKAQIDNAISSGDNYNEINAFVRSVLQRG